MNINELDSYNLADAVKFNDQLNPRLWDASEHLRPEVRERLLEIADDFRETLGVSDLELKDITISGSNAAYTYTPNSDIDLHLVVDLPEADRNEVYRELFDAKKYQYNDEHNIKIGNADVELYVENANQPPKSQGIYSILQNQWIQVPRRGRADIDDNSTKNKYETLSRQIRAAIKSGSAKRLSNLAAKIKKMRQTGLENHGEFGPENLAYKMLRSQGAIDDLYTARNQARDQELSLDEQQPAQPFVYGFRQVKEASSPDGVSPETKMFLSEEPPVDDESVLRDFVDFCVKELKIDSLPTIKLRRDPQWAVVHKTFGRYMNDKNLLEVAWGQRHLMDVLRTVAHELTHRHQHERDGDRMGPEAGETGSEWENEANARAGVLMRDYGRLHPELFDAGQAHNLDEGQESSLASMVSQDQAERNEYSQFVKSQAGGDWTQGAKMYAQLKKRPANDIFGDASRLNQFMKMTFDFDKFTDEDWDNYWLLAQHCDDNRNFQKQALATIKKYQGTEHSHYKYLYDRISVGLTGKQKYGTQNIDEAHSPEDFIQDIKKISRKKNKFQVGDWVTIDPNETAGWATSGMIGRIVSLTGDGRATINVNPGGGATGVQRRLNGIDADFNIKSSGTHTTVPLNMLEPLPVSLDESIRSRAAAAIVAMLLGQPIGAAAQSIQGILGMIRDAGTVVQQARNITRAGLNAEVQQEIVNYVRGVGGDAGSQNLSQLYQLQRQLQQQEQQEQGPQDQPQREPQNESASGYIPTKKQARDPRYSMALTVDIKPGQVGKEANKLRLRTDRQGHPQIANPNGLFEQLMMELEQFQTLDEVRMAPQDLKRFAASPAAKGIRAGFEAELIFTGIGEPVFDEMEPDMHYDERAYSIQQVINFFQNDDWGYGMSDSQASRVESQLDDMYLDWRDEQIREDFQYDSDERITELWLEDRPMTERIHDALTSGLELSDDEADAIMAFHARREGGKIKGSEMSEAELEMASQYSQARSIAMDILEEDVQGSIDTQDSIYDEALEEYRDNWSGDGESFFTDNGMRYMSDIQDHFNLDWPYMTEGDSGESSWSESSADRLGDSLSKALGVQTTVSNGYHSATRDESSWILEPDSSLEADDSDNMAVEIVSPPMPLDECLTKMQEFFAWAEKEGAYANSSTGFHMGVSLPTKFHEDVDFVKLILFLGDEYVLREFGRSANTYCRSAMEKLRNRLGNDRGTAVSGALDLMKNNLIELAHRSIADNMGFGKYTSINPKGNYIEFRSAGNSNYFEDIDKLKNTLLRYAQAMSIAGNPASERNEYAKKLYKLIAPAQSDPALALFSRFSAGELSAQELKSQWAELALEKERPKQGEEREWEAVDLAGRPLATTKDFSITNATNYFRDVLKLDGFQVREKLPEPTTPRAKLAKRIKTPKQKDDQQDSEQLQARIDSTAASIPRDWEFYRAETGVVIDRVSDADMMQANAVRADIVRRYGHPDASVRMRSVPTEQSAERARALARHEQEHIRAQARLGQSRPAFAGVQDLEPDVSQNFSDTQGTQLTVSGVPSWEIYNNDTNQVVRTFFQRDFQDAMVYAGQWLEANELGLEGYSVRPAMETP